MPFFVEPGKCTENAELVSEENKKTRSLRDYESKHDASENGAGCLDC